MMGSRRAEEGVPPYPSSSVDAVQAELRLLAKEAEELLRRSPTAGGLVATTAESVESPSAGLAALGEEALGAMKATNVRELGAMVAAAGAAAEQLSPRRELSLSPEPRANGSVAAEDEAHGHSGGDGSAEQPPTVAEAAGVSDDCVTMRSPALTSDTDNPSPRLATAAVTAAVDMYWPLHWKPTTIPPPMGTRMGEPFRVVLRKTHAHGLGLHCDATARVTGYHGRTARDAGVPLGATAMSIGSFKFVSIDKTGRPEFIGGQQQLARRLDSLLDFVQTMVDGERLDAVFLVATEPPSPKSALLPGSSTHPYDALKDEALLRVHTETGAEGDGQTLRATPSLLGPRLARVDRALCVMADPPLADDPTGLANASVAHGRIVFVHRGRVPFTSKIRAAQRAGAVGVVVINSADAPLLVDAYLESLDDGRECLAY
jgi:hypothetical protein